METVREKNRRKNESEINEGWDAESRGDATNYQTSMYLHNIGLERERWSK